MIICYIIVLILVLNLSSQLSMTDFNLSIDVLDVVGQYYPGLSMNERERIAGAIVENFDYAMLCDDIHEYILDCAAYDNINLNDKVEPNVQSHLTAI